MLRILIILCLMLVGCGTPREMPKTPPPYDFPPPIITDDYPIPDKIIGLSLSELRQMRPTIEKVYHADPVFFEYREVLTRHPYFSNVSYFLNYNLKSVYKISYLQNADVHNDPAYRLALIDQLIVKYGNPLVSKKGDIYIFDDDKYVLKLKDQTLEIISKNIKEMTE